MGFFSAVKKFFGKKDENRGGQEPAAPAATGAVEGATQIAEASEPEKDVIISLETPEEEKTDETSIVEAKATGPDINSAEQEMLARLRASEPKLSLWLAIVLEGVDGAGDLLWARLRFLLRALQAPEPEIENFVTDFQTWLQKMDYQYIDEFASELQYRLAIALDLEDEEDERARLLVKLGNGLAATRAKLGQSLNALFSSHGELTDEFWDELEEIFITADLGYDAATQMIERLKERAKKEKKSKAEDIKELLYKEIESVFQQPKRITAVNKPEVVLMIGVNGAGKTTTIAKLAHRERMAGKKVLIVAADTFRAAAIEQLEVWANRVGADFYAKSAGSDPAAVVWEAMDVGLKNNVDIIFIDTAGRLQTKVNLMEELGKIRQVAGKKHAGAPHRSILVLDATTGQNALSQAKLFGEACGVDELILTKLDGTAKGGVAIAVAMQEKLPITFVGLGEKMEDLRPFNGSDYANIILGEREQ